MWLYCNGLLASLVSGLQPDVVPRSIPILGVTASNNLRGSMAHPCLQSSHTKLNHTLTVQVSYSMAFSSTWLKDILANIVAHVGCGLYLTIAKTVGGPLRVSAGTVTLICHPNAIFPTKPISLLTIIVFSAFSFTVQISLLFKRPNAMH